MCDTVAHRNDLNPWQRKLRARFGTNVSGGFTDDLNPMNHKPERSLVGKKTSGRVEARRETGDCLRRHKNVLHRARSGGGILHLSRPQYLFAEETA